MQFIKFHIEFLLSVERLVPAFGESDCPCDHAFPQQTDSWQMARSFRTTLCSPSGGDPGATLPRTGGASQEGGNPVRQENRWLSHFPGGYTQSVAPRIENEAGPHLPQTRRLMLRRGKTFYRGFGNGNPPVIYKTDCRFYTKWYNDL